jgi:hypothetical protein
MDNLTATILANHHHLEVEEWSKQGNTIEYNSGNTQRIIRSSIPAIEMQISYRGLTFDQFTDLKNAYENNHSNTVIIDAQDVHDLRPDVMGLNSSTWAFKEFRFVVVAPKVYSGTIKMITSVFFNYTEYQNQFSQLSSYTPIVSVDDSFEGVLNIVTPHQVEYEYFSNSIFSNIGQSARHIKDKGGLRKKWKLSWFIDQSQFLELQKYYRKKAGIMGTFGIPEEGSTGINAEHVYLIDQDDYVATDYINNKEDLTKAMFMQDSFKFSRRVDNMYIVEADIIEAAA